MLYKSAVVALTDDAQLRADFERSLVEKARAHDYDAVASYEIVPNGVQAVLMLRPAAIGAGSSLESVRNEIPAADRAQGIARLQDLIVENVDGARPAIRQHLGLPPLN